MLLSQISIIATRLLLCLAILNSSLAHAELRALRITADNAAELIQTGPDAIGGIDDWFISNGTLCAVISDVAHENEFSSKGGVLVDLGFCDRADDHYTTSQDILDGQRTRPMDIDRIEIQLRENSVSLITHGGADGAVVETRYTLTEQQPTQLSISKQVSVIDEDKPSFNFYTPFWFNYHSMEPFVFSSQNPDTSRGFKNEDFVTRGSSAIRAAAAHADTIILSSPSDAETAISYGWQLRSAKRVSGDISYKVPTFVLADEESTVMLILTDSFYVGDGSYIGLLQLPQLPLLSLDEGDILEIEEVIYVGKTADVASITDQFFGNAPKVSGRVEELGSVLHVDFPDGTPFTFIRPAADGSFEFRAQPGEYRLRHKGSAGRETLQTIMVENSDVELEPLSLPKVATLKLPRSQAMRLVLVGMDGSDSPDFEARLTDFSVHDDEGEHFRDKISQLFLAGVDSDPKYVELAPGAYRVYATRGPEYSLEVSDITLAAGKTVDLQINTPKHEVETPGYIAADLHVHSGISFDNTFSTSARVRTFVAEHGEVMVSSEHDVLVDFAPFIDALGVADKITSIAATEMTSLLPSKINPFTGGHVNFFPVRPDPHAYRQGMPNHEYQRLRDLLHKFRAEHPGVLAQLNHARQNLSLSGALPQNYQELIDDAGYLDHMGVAGFPYNPELPLDTQPNSSLIEKDPITGVRDIDVDAFEIINPGGIFHQQRIIALRKDWFSFLRQGLRMTGTANSDSHHSGQQVAVPRNMVAVTGDNIANFDETEFLASLKSGNSYGTTGPMLTVSLSGVAMGQTFTGNKAVFNLTVSSASWIPLETVKIQINGEDEVTLDARGKKKFQVELEFSKDSFVTAELSGSPTAEYAAVYPMLTPYAFTNPIYVDFDADGKWLPPGLSKLTSD